MTATATRAIVAVTSVSPRRDRDAEELARTLGLVFTADAAQSACPFLLTFTETRLELRQRGTHSPGPIYVDFASGAVAYRRRFGGGRKQSLLKAIGLKPGRPPPRVLDATAGLGRDAFVMACQGCTVHLVERSAVIAALLRDGLERSARDREIGSVVRDRLTLSHGDARELMGNIRVSDRPDVVYLDPMYPQRSKSALVKKEMQALHTLLGQDETSPGLLSAALACARARVVVKRPRQAPSLPGPSPGLAIHTRTTRFDVYLINP